jgi:signal transduction histidine kinase/CheY-like chemotaxis protein
MNQRLGENSFGRRGAGPPPESGGSPSFSEREKPSRSKSQYLLEAACKVARASFGGLGFLSGNGELVDNPAWGVAEAVAHELSRSSWVQALIHFAVQQPEPTRLAGLSCAKQFGEVPPGVPAAGSILMIPLARPGRLHGALYLVRSAGQPPFAPEDEEAVLPISVCLQQGNLIEEASLLAQLRLLNRVAQAAAGNLELAPIFEATLRELDRHLPMCACAVWLVEAAAKNHSNRDDLQAGSVPIEDLEAAPDRGPARKRDMRDKPDSEVLLRLAAARGGQGIGTEELGLPSDLRLPLGRTPFAPCWHDGEGGVYTDWKVITDVTAVRPPQSSLGAVEDSTYPCFATPLRAGNRIVGILQSVCSRPTGFRVEQVQLLYLVADLLGPAISNCQLFDRLRVTYEELRTTQVQLIRNEKLRAIGELASGMAHDFNNSLCGVLGFLEIAMTDKLLTSSSRANLDLARSCALAAAETVHRVQDFARVRPKDVVCQPIDLGELVRKTVELARPKWENVNRSQTKPIIVQLDTAISGGVSGNLAELREVLTNLIFNAVDAMPEGGTLTIRSWVQAETALISVSDTGVGMLPAVQQRLFEPFFSTKGERGNGMGLSVAFGIVKRHGGDITVASEAGRGSTFTIRLPAAAADATRSSGEKASEEKAPATDRSALPSLRILVVEDETTVRHFLTTVLTTLGHRPRGTRNGNEALKTFAEEPFDVVVTDMGLPGISGEEVARRLAHKSPGVPIVLLTGWADQIKSEAKSLPGVTRVLGKPVSTQQLAETLMAVCPR